MPSKDASPPRTKKVVLITGITGQDGSYMAEFLLEKGYEVHGLIRPTSTITTSRIAHIKHKLTFHQGDLMDAPSLNRIVANLLPDEIYNFASQPHVKVSENLPEYTAEATGVGVLRLLEAVKDAGIEKSVKFYQASTSELFGKAKDVPQKETTPFQPRSPYGCAKLFAHWTVVNFREANNCFAVNGIVFNHESPRRGENFVTRKITRSVAKVHLGLLDYFELGNLDSKRDWGHAKDFVEAIWMMMQLDKPCDYVVATGELRSVRQFVEYAFAYVKKTVEWSGKGVNEVGIVDGQVRVKVNPKFYRPIEPVDVVGDASLFRAASGWKPKIGLQELVSDMMQSDIERMKKDPEA